RVRVALVHIQLVGGPTFGQSDQTEADELRHRGALALPAQDRLEVLDQPGHPRALRPASSRPTVADRAASRSAAAGGFDTAPGARYSEAVRGRVPLRITGRAARSLDTWREQW